MMLSGYLKGKLDIKMTEKTVAVFGDLTALYSARTLLKKNINYNHVDSAIKKLFGVNELNASIWYTLFHPENKSQVDFVKTLEALNWKVKTKRPSEVRRSSSNNNPHTDYRFDAQIAYNIGEATGEYDQIIVISDSLELLNPLKEASAFLDVTLSFFTEAMDRRWRRPLEESNVKFIDLGKMLQTTREETFQQPYLQDSARFE